MTLDYKTIGHALQVEGDKVHVDQAFFDEQGIAVSDNLSREEGVRVFNDVAEQNGLNLLRDPLGYMKLDDNLYDNIHDQYTDAYEDAIDKVNNQIIGGGAYGMEAVLDKLNKTTRHDFSKVLPKEMKYSDLRFVKATDGMKETVGQMAKTRVQMTYAHGMSRSVEEGTKERLQQEYSRQGLRLQSQIVNGDEPKKERLSSKRLMENSGADKATVQKFGELLQNPQTIEKAEGAEHATASFETKDIQFAKFLMANKSYLKDVGDFDIKKSSGKIITSWQSEQVDKMYEETKTDTVDLDFTGLDGGKGLQQ